MKKLDETISLLAFIESKQEGFFLDIPVIDQDRASFHGDAYPFQLATKEQNFSILVKAGVKVKHSDPFKSLFLLVQRDHYPIHPDALTPFTNTVMDRIWHETILSYAEEKNVFIDPRQLIRDGQATPFGSLFFCKKKKKFFHPPCPECGAALALCRDDEHLIKHVLFPYSTSLKRYLFCPVCHGAGESHIFYQFSRSADDPVFIKDRFDLVRDFHRLQNKASGDFPCLECAGHAECYITGEKAGSNIGFFSFYPFHMLFFDAEPITAIDFLPFLSGAGFEESNAIFPQKKELFFFREDERFFLEVLFLKLSFFEEIIGAIHRRIGKNKYPPVNLSVQNIWIRPQTPGGILPFFWDFKLSIVDLVSNSQKPCISSVLSRNSSLQFVASLFFYIFLVNSRQELETVYSAVEKLIEKSGNNPFPPDYNRLAQEFPAIAIENIFWNPNSGAVSKKFHDFWMKTIMTGLSIFDTGKKQGLKEDLTDLAGILQSLKQQVKEELFSKGMKPASALHKPPAAPLETTAAAAGERVRLENQAIAMVLKKLKTQWEAGADPSFDPEEDVLETIVLSSMENVPDTDFDDSVEKTMILAAPEKETDREKGFDEMEKTVVLSPGGTANKDSGFFGENDDLDKTVVISPKK